MPKFRSIFRTGKPNPQLSRAIKITSPSQFRASIKRVKRLRGISATKKKRALVLAQNRAMAQLRRRNLSMKERKQFRAISRVRLPPMKRL